MASIVFPTYDFDYFDSDQDIDALIRGLAWDISATGGVITYSFPTGSGDLGYTLDPGVNFSSGFTADQIDTALDAMALIESYTMIDFQAGTAADATVRWFNVTGIGTAFGYYPNTGPSGGDMAFLEGAYDTNLFGGTYETTTFMHELGHALGLKHGHEFGYGGAMPFDKNSMEYSIMTYQSYDGHDLNDLPFYVNADGSYAQTYMISDIAALQRMYGANYETNSGDTVYTFSTSTGEMFVDGVGQGTSTTNTVFRALWDGNGNDTYDLSNYTTRLEIDLRPGAYSNFDRDGNFQRAELNFGIALDNQTLQYIYSTLYEVYADGHLYNAYLFEDNVQSLIENAIGGSNGDRIHGNEVANRLEGRGGRDKLFGYEGDDTLIGNARKDRLVGGEGNDTLLGGNGYDNLRGGKGDDFLNGGRKDDMLTGGAGDDTFFFNTASATDTVKDFGTGDDTLDFSAFDFASRQAALNTGVQSGDDVVFDLGGGVVVILENVQLNTLTVDDFLI